jgi:hypothetical protein
MTAEPVAPYEDDFPPVRRGGAVAPDRERTRRTGTEAPSRREIPAQRRPATRPTTRRATPPVPVSAPRAPFVVLVLALVAAGIVGLLLLNTAINTNAFTLSRLRDKQSTLDAREQQYKRDLADLESPGSLQAAATRMGLVPAGSTAFIRLPDGKVIGVPQPAPAASDPGTR